MGWPRSVKQIFSSVGSDVTHGARLSACAGLGNPYKQAFEDWGVATSGRSAWDPIAVLIAVRGAAGAHCAEYDNGGSMAVAESGEETWTPPPASRTSSAPLTLFNQSRIAFSGSDARAQIGAEIDALLCKPPGAWSQTHWSKAEGENCYGTRGSAPAHGATDLEHPVTASCGSFRTVAECEARCVALPGCTAIAVTKEAGSGNWSCFRKADVVLAECDRATAFDTYVRHTYVLARGFNCYGARGDVPAHGATDLEHPAAASCGSFSVRGCAAQCVALAECDAFVWSGRDHAGEGECFRKAAVDLAHCDADTAFDTYISGI